MEGGGGESFDTFEGVSQKLLPCLKGRERKVSDLQFSHFVTPLLPVIIKPRGSSRLDAVVNDQSLSRKGPLMGGPNVACPF